jgi:prolyl-tRNA synthetase
MKEDTVHRYPETIYQQLVSSGVEVCWMTGMNAPGFKFKDADLIGIPLRIVVGSKNC